MSKEFALEQITRHGGAVDRDQGPITPCAGLYYALDSSLGSDRDCEAQEPFSFHGESRNPHRRADEVAF